MKAVISQPMFFPWIGFFEQMKLCDTYVHYNDVQYSKGGFTNRVQIKTPEGVKWLTVPLKDLHLGQRIDQVKINNQSDWRKSHMAQLRRCYESAPYCVDMLNVVDDIYGREWEFLDDLSRATLKAVCKYYDLFEGKHFVEIEELDVNGVSSERVLAVAVKVGANTYITGHGASKYLDHRAFEESGVKVEYMKYLKTPYPQQYGEFNPYVSILDLIANVGKDGINWIHSVTIDWKDHIHERS